MVKQYQALVQKRNLKGWRIVKSGRKEWYGKAKAKKIKVKFEKKGRRVKIRSRKNQAYANNVLIETWLRGDLDFDRDTMIRLAKVARDIKHVLYVNYGKRTYVEQLALWNRYGPPRAARTGTSRHETGK